MFDTFVWHFTATFEDQDITAADVDRWHRQRGFAGIGYHFLIRLDGTLETGRPLGRTGAHVKGQNRHKLGAAYVGGCKRAYGPTRGFDTRTPAQHLAMLSLTSAMLARYPSIKRVCGHNDLAPTQCPGFDVGEWWKGARHGTP